ncbi:MAG: hypothetical protein IKC22_04760 [Bacilli bacterium]|nr:hypothetical protein [Bacilli bacterium]
MAKNEKFITKKTRGNKEEYAIRKSPTKTLAGKILVWIIVIGTLLLPVVAAIVSLFH